MGKSYDRLYSLFFDFEEALTLFIIENFDNIFKFTCVDNVAKELNLPKFHLWEY